VIISDGSDFVTVRKQMRTGKFNGNRNANGQAQGSLRQDPGGCRPKFKPKRNRGHIGDNVFWHSKDEMVRVVRKITQRSESIVEIILHSEGLDVFFGKKPQSDPRVAESAERLDSMRQAFKNERCCSTVLKTWTPPKPSGPARKRKLGRINRRLYEKMQEELQEVQEAKLLEKGDGATSSVLEAWTLCEKVMKCSVEI